MLKSAGGSREKSKNICEAKHEKLPGTLSARPRQKILWLEVLRVCLPLM